MADAASVTDEPEVQSEKQELKHLGFVEEALGQVVEYVSKAYDYVKESSGSLKPGVEKIETTLKSIVAPAIEKFQDVPEEVLKYVDRKVDESVTQLDSILPDTVKETAKSLLPEVKTVGVVETAKELLVKIEPVAEEYASSAWKTVRKVPLVATVVKALAPTATYITEKYNETVKQTADEGYTVSSYLPLVPTEKIAKVFTIDEPETETVAPDEGEEAAEAPVEGEEPVAE